MQRAAALARRFDLRWRVAMQWLRQPNSREIPIFEGFARLRKC
jgi:hypothetical protein